VTAERRRRGRRVLQNVSANAVALFRNIKRLKLDVAQHVPIHGNPGGITEGLPSAAPARASLSSS
jgi:hypothetical protein